MDVIIIIIIIIIIMIIIITNDYNVRNAKGATQALYN